MSCFITTFWSNKFLKTKLDFVTNKCEKIFSKKGVFHQGDFPPMRSPTSVIKIGGRSYLWEILLVGDLIGGKEHWWKTPFFENIFSHLLVTKSNFVFKKLVWPKSCNKIRHFFKTSVSKIGGRSHWWKISLVEKHLGGKAP